MLRRIKNCLYLHRGIDVNRASPVEDGIDVFNDTWERILETTRIAVPRLFKSPLFL